MLHCHVRCMVSQATVTRLQVTGKQRWRGCVAAVATLVLIVSACSRTQRASAPSERETALHEVERSTIDIGEETLSLHLPQGAEAPLPTVLVLHSAMGRTDSVLAWCDRLAEHGFAAVAFDFFGGRIARSTAHAMELRDAANSRSTDLQAALEHAYEKLRTDPRLRARRRFLLGWSYGAAWATYATGFLPDVSGVVAYYGQSFTENPQLVATLDSPLLLIGGDRDSAPPPERLMTITAELAARGKPARLRLFPAGHGFAEATHPGYDEDVAEQAWTTTIAFLRKAVAAPSHAGERDR